MHQTIENAGTLSGVIISASTLVFGITIQDWVIVLTGISLLFSVGLRVMTLAKWALQRPRK